MVISPDEIDERTVPIPATYAALVEVDDGGLLVDEEAGRGYPMNATASLLWKLLDSASPLGDLIDDVTGAFDAPRSAVAESVHDIVRTWAHLGLLKNVSRDFASMPLEIDYADPDTCDEPAPPDSAEERAFDSRYRAVPPNA